MKDTTKITIGEARIDSATKKLVKVLNKVRVSPGQPWKDLYRVTDDGQTAYRQFGHMLYAVPSIPGK